MQPTIILENSVNKSSDRDVVHAGSGDPSFGVSITFLAEEGDVGLWKSGNGQDEKFEIIVRTDDEIPLLLKLNQEYIAGTVSVATGYNIPEKILIDDTSKEKFERLFMDLLHSLKVEPVEDGVPHVGEEIIATILRESNASILANRALSIGNNPTKASVMRLMGRVPMPDIHVRRKIVSEGLASKNLEIRDAALQMVETWEDPECLDLLKNHKESLDWLNDYIRDIIKYIEN